MKALVETNGDFGLHDLMGRQTVFSYRPTVVELTPFIDANRGTKITLIEILADEAADTGLALATDDDKLAAAIAALPRPEEAPKSVKPVSKGK